MSTILIAGGVTAVATATMALSALVLRAERRSAAVRDRILRYTDHAS
jgi:hypothetical protein